MRLRLFAAAAVVAVLVLAGWASWERSHRLAYVSTIEANSQQEFYNLLSRTEETEVALAKGLVANSTGQQIFYLTDVWNKSSDAQNSLSQLPVPDLNLSATRKFLAQLGDYSLSLARKVTEGSPLTDSDRANLSRFQAELGEFCSRLHSLETELHGRNFRWVSLIGAGTTPQAAVSTAGTVQAAADTFNPFSGIGNLDNQLQQLPSLTYDGPFSDHLLRLAPKGLTGPRINQPEARAKAISFAGATGPSNVKVTTTRRNSGPIPAYSFLLKTPNGVGETSVDISEVGGHVLEMLTNRTLGAPQLDAAEALKRAETMVKQAGYHNMTPTYSLREQNGQTITFAGQKDGVIIYPDMIKVKVALDNGEIVGWNATSYLANHHERTLPKPRLNEAQARAKVNPSLTVERSRLTLIPTAGGNEELAWEFSTTTHEDRFLIYINALTGAEEQILKVVEQAGGQLTM